jgi:hypothetical protein
VLQTLCHSFDTLERGRWRANINSLLASSFGRRRQQTEQRHIQQYLSPPSKDVPISKRYGVFVPDGKFLPPSPSCNDRDNAAFGSRSACQRRRFGLDFPIWATHTSMLSTGSAMTVTCCWVTRLRRPALTLTDWLICIHVLHQPATTMFQHTTCAEDQ